MFQPVNLSCYDKSQQAQGKLPVCQYWHEEDTLSDMTDIKYYDQKYLKQLMNGLDFVLRVFSKKESSESALVFVYDKVTNLYNLRQLGSGSGLQDKTSDNTVLQFGDKVIQSGVITIGVVNPNVANSNNPVSLAVAMDMTTPYSIICTPSNTVEAFDRLIADYGNQTANGFEICVRNLSDDIAAENVVVSWIVIGKVSG